MDISFEYYRIFYYAAKYQNLTLAARVLLCHQPNVTRAIKGLEQALGCVLFVRSNRGVRLTTEGERLYAHVRIAVEQIELAVAELSGTQAMESGVVAVETTEIALHTFLLPVLNEYRRRFPGIRMNISNNTTTQAAAAVRSSLADIAVVTIPPGEKIQGLKVRALRTVAEAPVCGPGFIALTGGPVTLAQLAEYPLISLGTKTRTYEMYSRWFSRHGLPYTPAIEAATADQILPLVRNNLGIGFVPVDFLLDGGDQEIYRISLTEPAPERAVALLKRRDGVLSAAARALERLIWEHAAVSDNGL